MEYSTLSLSKFCFAALSLTVRGYEPGLFHAYWVISSWGFRFLQMFSDRIWSQMQFTIKWFSFTCLSLKLFLLWLNNLSFFGFLRNAWTWIERCLYFCFGCEYHDLLICFDARTVGYLQNTRQWICSDWKTLENQLTDLQANSRLQGIWSIFYSEEGFKVWTALSLFTVDDPCQLPSVNFDMSLCPTVTHT